ncbi:MAG: RAD55 family ATPase [Ignisphaera sp.]
MGIEIIKFGLDILDEVLPEGIPRSSFIIITGLGGTGKTFLTLNIAKQFLLRGEPVIYVVFDDDPITIINMLAYLGIDVYEYVRNRNLMIVDGFSFRIRNKKGKLHISVVEEVDPQNPEQVLYTIMQLLEKLELKGKGVVIIDSLNEFLAHHDYAKVEEFIKNIRANIVKYKGILTISILHTSADKAKQLLLSIEHIVDGVIFMDKQFKDGTVVRYLVIKRVRGASHKVDRVEFILSSKGIEKFFPELKTENLRS